MKKENMILWGLIVLFAVLMSIPYLIPHAGFVAHFGLIPLLCMERIADITGIMAEKEEDPKVKALETSIDDMEFSVRAYNCLKRSNINTMQDLVNMKESEIMKIRNLGKKSLKEVIDKVKSMGLSFKAEE